MDLPLDPKLSIGIQTIHRRTEPAAGPRLPRINELVALVELVDRCGYDSLWVGDHIAWPCQFSTRCNRWRRPRWSAAG